MFFLFSFCLKLFLFLEDWLYYYFWQSWCPSLEKLVFSGTEGQYISRNRVGNQLNKIKKATDYEYITVHFLRHVNATLLLMNKVDLKIVSAHLGHGDITTTADIDADVLRSAHQEVAQLIEFYLEDDKNND